MNYSLKSLIIMIFSYTFFTVKVLKIINNEANYRRFRFYTARFSMDIMDEL
jgi:hypothetical protein